LDRGVRRIASRKGKSYRKKKEYSAGLGSAREGGYGVAWKGRSSFYWGISSGNNPIGEGVSEEQCMAYERNRVGGQKRKRKKRKGRGVHRRQGSDNIFFNQQKGKRDDTKENLDCGKGSEGR